VAILSPVGSQDSLFVPAAALTNQGYGDELAVGAIRPWTGAAQRWDTWGLEVVDQDKQAQAEIVEIDYHRSVLR